MNSTAIRPPGPTRLRLHVAPGVADDFELWRHGVAPVSVMDAADREVRQSFRLDGTACQFAGFSVSSLTASATRFDRSWQVIARSGIDHFILSAFLKGGGRLEAGGRETEVRAGDIYVLDLARPYRSWTTSYTDMTVVLPRVALERLVPEPDALHGYVLRRGSPLNALLLSHMRALHAEAPNLGRDEARFAARTTANLIAACVGPSTATRHMAGEAAATATTRWLRGLIEANLGDPGLGPDFLLQSGGLSRATLYRLFRPFGGVSNYIRQRRLVRAVGMLSDPALRDEGAGSVAARCGFASNAAFSRALRLTYGTSPGDIRAAAGSGQRRALRRDSDGSFGEVNRWLLGLTAAGA